MAEEKFTDQKKLDAHLTTFVSVAITDEVDPETGKLIHHLTYPRAVERQRLIDEGLAKEN
jgi:hypothetical protein